MPKRKIWLQVLVPLFALLATALVAELALRLLTRAPEEWSFADQIKLINEGNRLYPPSEPLFAAFCNDRPVLPHENRAVLGSKLREYDYPQVKPAGTYRILGLGDSFAWGWGMVDNRRTFFKLLECWLNKRYPDTPVEVINASKPASAVSYYGRFLETLGWNLKPDRVVISFNINDAYVPHVSVTVEAKSAQQLEQKAGFWTRHSRLVRFVRERLIRVKVRRDFVASVRDAYLGKERAQRWERAQADLRAIAAGCRERNIDLLVAVFPLLVDLDRKYPFSAEVDEIVRFCRESGIECVDLLPSFLGKKPEYFWTLPTNAHPNEVAMRLAAEAIFKALVEKGPLKPA